MHDEFRETREVLNSDGLDALRHIFLPEMVKLVSAAMKHGKAISLLLSLQRWFEEMRQLLGSAVQETYKNDRGEPPKYFDEARGGSIDVPIAFTPYVSENYWSARLDRYRYGSLQGVPEHLATMANKAGLGASTLEEIFDKCHDRLAEKDPVLKKNPILNIIYPDDAPADSTTPAKAFGKDELFRPADEKMAKYGNAWGEQPGDPKYEARYKGRKRGKLKTTPPPVSE
jgi:hypothetical protein